MCTTETALHATLAARPVMAVPAVSGRTTSRNLMPHAPASRLGKLAAALSVVGRVLRNRRTTATLQNLDERQLADIGLTRNDVLRATGAAFSQDTTRYLTLVARNRVRDYYRNVERR